MTHHAEVAWSMDWDDDDYASAHSAIPRAHIDTYRTDLGSTLTADTPAVGVLFADVGHLRLYEPDGLYLGLTDLTAEQLSYPHRYRLSVDGQLVRSGRAHPVLSTVLGADVRPVTWRLESANADLLASRTTYSHSGGTLAAILADISALTGLSLSTRSMQTIGTIDEWTGTWARLLNELANVAGGWACELADDTIEIMSARDFEPLAAELSLTTADSLAADRSGMGLQSALVRTRFDVPATPDAEATTRIFGNEERYGRRPYQIQEWFPTDDAGLVSFLAVLHQRITPATYVQIDVGAELPSAARAQEVAQALTPGHVVTATMPSPTGMQTARFTVLRQTITGGSDQPMERLTRGLSFTPPDIVTTVSARVTGSSTATLTITTDPDSTTRYVRWRRRGRSVWLTATYEATEATHTLDLDSLAAGQTYDVEVSSHADYSDPATTTFTTQLVALQVLAAVTDTTATFTVTSPAGGQRWWRWRAVGTTDWTTGTYTAADTPASDDVVITGLDPNTEYVFQVSTAANYHAPTEVTVRTLASALVISVVTPTTSSVSWLVSGTVDLTIYWRIRRAGTSAWTWSGSRNQDGSPQGIDSADGVPTTLAEGTPYELQVSNQSDYSDPVIATFSTLVTELSFAVTRQTSPQRVFVDVTTPVDSARTYHWRWRRRDDENDWDESGTFTASQATTRIDLGASLPLRPSFLAGRIYEVQVSPNADYSDAWGLAFSGPITFTATNRTRTSLSVDYLVGTLQDIDWRVAANRRLVASGSNSTSSSSPRFDVVVSGLTPATVYDFFGEPEDVNDTLNPIALTYGAGRWFPHWVSSHASFSTLA